MRSGLMLALVLAACSSKQPPPTGGTGSAEHAGACEVVRAKVEALYRAEAQAKEPERVAEAVADNTAMVLGECARTPDRVLPCVQGAQTVEILERTCLAPLDDEGTEGEALRK